MIPHTAAFVKFYAEIFRTSDRPIHGQLPDGIFVQGQFFFRFPFQIPQIVQHGFQLFFQIL